MPVTVFTPIKCYFSIINASIKLTLIVQQGHENPTIDNNILVTTTENVCAFILLISNKEKASETQAFRAKISSSFRDVIHLSVIL